MTNPSSDDWHVISKHNVRLEPPDVIHTRPNGDISLDESIGLMTFVRSLQRPEKGFFGLIDMTHAGRQDPAITKHPDASAFLTAYRAQAFYNATFSQRTLIGIFERVRKLLRSGVPQIPIVIFPTEAEARAWIEKFRNEDREP